MSYSGGFLVISAKSVRFLMKFTVRLLFMLALSARCLLAQGPDTVFLEELTWTEIRDRIAQGPTSAIIATGGTEQNGPHMVTGKHNFIVRETAEKIARELGDTLVAPIVAFVPEGDPDNVMKPGVISLPNKFFVKLLENAARSLKSGGFTDIILIGDSGGNQLGMQEMAKLLNMEWKEEAGRIHYVSDYYHNNGFRDWLLSQGETREDIGTHAGITDTSQLLALDPALIRPNLMAPMGGFEGSGVRGNPLKARAEYGRIGLQMKVDAALKQIRKLMAARN